MDARTPSALTTVVWMLAWHDKDAQKLPRWQVVVAYLLFPVIVIFGNRYWQLDEEYQFVTLWEYAGTGGKVYVIAVSMLYAAVVLGLLLMAFPRHP